MIKHVYLHGALARYGACHDLDVRDAPEACRLLAAQLPGFRDTLTGGRWQVYRGPIELGDRVTEESLTLALGKTAELHIMPAAEGAGIGVALVGGALLAGGTIGGYTTLALVGASLLIGGVTQMLTSTPSTGSYSNREEPKERPSFLFDGPTNTSTQGLPVPVVYGRMRTGSIVVSSGISAEEISIDGNSKKNNVVTNPGGDPEGVGGRKGGGKGGGGGRQHVPTEDPNTLRSDATVRLVDVVSEGPIVGLVNGWKSIYFDDTPVANENGSYNFHGIRRTDRYGHPDQEPFPDQSAVEHAEDVSVKVEHNSPIVRTITDIDADAVRITVQVPALSHQDRKTGDLHGSEVQFAIDVRANGGGWKHKLTNKIKGKTTSPYQRSKRVHLQGEGPWDVRVRRITKDNDSASTRNDLYWASYTYIINAHLIYPDTAAFGFEVDARQFGDSVPARKYDIKGRTISVPSNYDPESRHYSGVWDGSFKEAWTDNPAWVYYDLATNTRYGAGIANVDKTELYVIAQYCDERVPDGFGGHEPRFTINTVISDRKEAHDALNHLASVFRGMTFWGDNSLMPVADKPSDPVKLVTPANVIDGHFEYAGPGRSVQHSAWLVSYNDPDRNDRLTPEVVEDPARIQKMGWKPMEITAFGCNSRGQARRVGEWARETENHEGETVSYQAGTDHADLRPGDIIKLQDPRRAGARLSGRFQVVSKQELTLDQAPDVVDSDETWYLDAVLSDGSVERQEIAHFDGDTVTLVEALSEQPVAGGIWILSSSSVEPTLWRVTQNLERGADSGRLRYAVQAVRHDPNKYDRVERGIKFDDPETSLIPTGAIAPPEGVSAKGYVHSNSKRWHQTLSVSVKASDDARVSRYLIEAKGPHDARWIKLSEDDSLSADIKDAAPGQYDIRARAVGGLNKHSQIVQGLYILSNLLKPDEPKIDEVETGESALVKVSDGSVVPGIRVTFSGPDSGDGPRSTQLQYRLNGGDWSHLYTTDNTSGAVLMSPAEAGDRADVRIRAERGGETSDWVHEQFVRVTGKNSQPPPVQGFDVVLQKYSAQLSWDDLDLLDIAGYVIEQKINNEWTYQTKTDSTKETIDVLPTDQKAEKIYEFRIRAFDSGGRHADQWTEASATVRAPQIENINYIFDGDEMVLSWGASHSDFPISGYRVYDGAVLIDELKSRQFKKKVNWGGAKKWQVSAVDAADNEGVAKSVTVVVDLPSVAMRSPQTIDNNALLYWDVTKGSLPIDHYEIKRGDYVAGITKGTFDSIFETKGGDYAYTAVPVDTAGNRGGSDVVNVYLNPPPDFKLYFDNNAAFLDYGESYLDGADFANWSHVDVTPQPLDSNNTLYRNAPSYQLVAPDASGPFTSPELYIDESGNFIYHVSVYIQRDSHRYIKFSGFGQGDKGISFDVIGNKASVVAGWDDCGIQQINDQWAFLWGQVKSKGQHWEIAPVDAYQSETIVADAAIAAFLPRVTDSEMPSHTRTKTNTLIQHKRLLAPVNLVETWEEHFVNNGWTSPQDQVDAGYPLYIQPVPTEAEYTEIYDVGSVLSGTQVRVGKTIHGGADNLQIKPTISTKREIGDAWTDFDEGQSTVYSTNFRYIKLRFRIESNGKAVADVRKIQVEAMVKKVSDDGTVTVTQNPTTVSFNQDFVDVSSITLTVKGTAGGKKADYDFDDGPNPENFDIYLFDKDGNATTGVVSWQARGN